MLDERKEILESNVERKFWKVERLVVHEGILVVKLESN